MNDADNKIKRDDTDDIVNVIPDPDGNDGYIGGIPNVISDDVDLSDLTKDVGIDDIVTEVAGETEDDVKTAEAPEPDDYVKKKNPEPKEDLVWTGGDADELDETEFYISNSKHGAGEAFSDTIDIPIILERHREDTEPHTKIGTGTFTFSDKKGESEVRGKIEKTGKKYRRDDTVTMRAVKKKAEPVKDSDTKVIDKVVTDKKEEAPTEEKKLPVAIARKRFSLFYFIYFLLIGIFILALTISLFVIRRKLAEYEISRPYNCIENAIDEYFAPGSAEELLKIAKYEVSPFEEHAEVVKLVNGYLDAGCGYYSTASSGDSLTYAVTSGELKLASVSISPSGELDGAGYDIYKIDDIKLMVGGSRAIVIDAPSTDRVFLNGRELTEDYITDRVKEERNRHIPDDIPDEETVTYRITGLIGEPSVTVKDKYGEYVDDITVRDGVFFEVPKTYAKLTDEVEALALEGGEALAAYMQKDADFWKIGQYVDPSSDLYVDLLTSEVRWADDHNGYDIVSPSVSEYTIWSDTVYSVRVKFTHVLFQWSGNFENEFDTTFYYKWNGAKWVIYDSQVN